MGYQPTLAAEMGDLQERITSTTTEASDHCRSRPSMSPLAAISPTRLLANTFCARVRPSFWSAPLPNWGSIRRSIPLPRLQSAFALKSWEKSITRWPGVFKKSFSATRDLQDIIAILGMDELSPDDKLTVFRARKIQRFPEPCRSTWRRFSLERRVNTSPFPKRSAVSREILDGNHDGVNEANFYMKGGIEMIKE